MGLDLGVDLAVDVGGAEEDFLDVLRDEEVGVAELEVFLEVVPFEFVERGAVEDAGVLEIPAGGDFGGEVEEGLAVELDGVAGVVEGEHLDEVGGLVAQDFKPGVGVLEDGKMKTRLQRVRLMSTKWTMSRLGTRKSGWVKMKRKFLRKELMK